MKNGYIILAMAENEKAILTISRERYFSAVNLQLNSSTEMAVKKNILISQQIFKQLKTHQEISEGAADFN